MTTNLRTQPKVLCVLDAVTPDENGEPIVQQKPVFMSLWLAMSKDMPISAEWVRKN